MSFRILCTSLLWALALCGQSLAAGTVETVTFDAPSLGGQRAAQVYLPEGYDPAGSTLYPAIYFCHGANGSHLLYSELYGILDNLIGGGQIAPVVMIKPDGSGCPWDPYWEGCGWVNSELQGNYEDYLIEDVITFAQETYKVIPSPHKRALMGHSMGAFGTMHAALKHPDLFRAVAAHSGYPHFEEMHNQHQPQIVAEYTSPPPWEYTPNNFWTGAWFMFSGGFSPNLQNPPYYVDFPLDGYGDRIPEVWERWLTFDPATLALSVSPSDAPAIYFDCGTYDEFRLHAVNEQFDALLTSLGIEHTWESYVGGHGNMLHLRFPIALEFLDQALNDPSTVPDMGRPIGAGILEFDVPSPVTGSAELHFETSSDGHVTLQVYDVLGRLEATLLDEESVAGARRIQWDAMGVPSGVYFCRLRAGGQCESRTLVVR